MNHRQNALVRALALTVSLSAVTAQAGTLPATGPSDFTLDPSFGTGGSTTLEFENGVRQWDEPLAAFQDADGGYWIAGFNRSADGGDDALAIAKLVAEGSPDAAVGDGGRLLLAPTGTEVRAVTKAGTRFYAAEAVLGRGADVVVDCFEISGAVCDGFGDGGHVQVAFDLGGSDDDVAAAIVVDDGAIYVAGNMSTPSAAGGASNPGIGLIKLDAATGSLDAAFGNLDGLPGRALYQLDRVVDGGDYVATNGLVVADAPAGGRRLLVTGNTPTSNVGDAEGFVIAFDAASGALADDFGDGGVRYLTLPPGDTFGEVLPTAIALRHDGAVLVAGDYWHDIDGAVDPEVMLAELGPDGTLAADFGDGGLFHYLPGYRVETLGVAERPGSGDVVATFMTAGLFPDDYTDYQQALIQVDRRAHAVRALTAITFPSNGIDTAARSRPAPQGVFVDERNRTVLIGWRNWQYQPRQGLFNRDMTVARFTAEDSLFANGFGGAYAD
ncbi:MAG TPA: hypothetical protein VGC30_00075 [Dokdonella sp.]